MARMSKEELARLSGANWALEMVKKQGVEATEKELERRGAIGLPLAFSNADKRNCEDTIRRVITDGITCVVSMTLHDEFGFGHDRLDRFIKRFNNTIDCLLEEYVTWEEMVAVLKEEVKIDAKIPQND